MDRGSVARQKFWEKRGHEKVLLDESHESCLRDAQGRWASAGAERGVPRSSNGGESCFRVLKEVVVDGELLLPVIFLNGTKNRAKAWPLKLETEVRL